MSTISISKENALAAFNNADAKGKQLLTDLLGKENLVQQKITDRVKDFNDILRISGRTMESLINPHDTIDEIAYKKIKLIAEVYNEGEVLDGLNTKQNKYYPWHEVKPGVGLSCFGYVRWRTASYVGVRLCFKSAELAIDAGKKFLDIYTDLKVK